MRRLLVPLALSMLASYACSSDLDERFVEVSGEMPSISGPTLTGEDIGPSELAGKAVVVNFWNPECPPCREEAPVLQSMWEELRDDGVVVVGLMFVGGNWPDDRQAARRFLRDHGLTYPNLVDHESELALEFGIAGIPTTVVVDAEGEMRFRILGKVHPGDLERLIDRLPEMP